MRIIFLCSLFLLLALPLWAEEKHIPVPDGLPEEMLEQSDITIIQSEQATIQEYRLNGRLYLVQIQPQGGSVYYLIDTDGDGELDTRSDEIGDIQVNQWLLFSW